jgi:hypothetical protein
MLFIPDGFTTTIAESFVSSSAHMLHGKILVITNTDDDNLFDEDFAEDA